MVDMSPNDWHRYLNSLRGTRVLVEDSPAWVTRRKVTATERVPGEPVTVLLIDRQIHADRMVRYTRHVRRLETPQSVQDAGRIELGFDPATQKILIHAISIFRNGELKNLADLEEVKLIQRERELDKGIYDGTITALILLKDLRTGDVIDIETSISSEDAIFPGHYWFEENFEHVFPVTRHFFSWMTEDFGRFHIEDSSLGIEASDEETPHGIRRTWENPRQAALDIPPCLPLGYNPFRHLSITSFASWQEVAREVSKLWERSEKPGDELPVELLSLKEKHHEGEVNLMEALVAFVRDNIRYQGVETGRLGLVPEELHTIWERRFGDCKEKTSLLCWMLRECGFEATPALVSTVFQGRIAGLIPAPYFDHVVVHLRHGEKDHWIDPTDVSRRGSLEDWTSLPFGKALLISPHTIDFIEISEAKPGQNMLEVNEEYRFPGNGRDAEVSVTHIYHGTQADGARHALDSQGRVGVQQVFAEIIKSTRPGAELKNDMEVTDDQEANVLTLRAVFFAPETLAPRKVAGSLAAEFAPHSIVGKLVGVDDKPRKMPLGLVHPVDVRHSTSLHHRDSKGAVLPKTSINNEFISFVSETDNSGEYPSLKYRYFTKKAEIPADEIRRYRLNLRQISESISIVFETKGGGRRSGSGSLPGGSRSWEDEELDPGTQRQRRYVSHYENTRSGRVPYWLIGVGVLIVIKFLAAVLAGA